MKTSGNAAAEDRKKLYAYCAFAAIVIGYLYFEFFRDPTPTAPAPTVVAVPARTTTAAALAADEAPVVGAAAGARPLGPAAKVVGKTAAALDPTLHMDAMLVTESVAYEGPGRNIFSAASAPPPVVIPKAIAAARPLPQLPPPPPVPCPPNCPPPPPPPPIDLKFIGTLESPPGSGSRRAFLVHGEDVSLAAAGEIILRKYRVVSISANSIQVEDMANNNTQTLPFLGNR